MNLHALLERHRFEQLDGVAAVGAARAQYFDVRHTVFLVCAYSTALKTYPTSRMPAATTAMKVAMRRALSTLRRITISGSDSAITLIMKASPVPRAAPFVRRACTIGMTPAALVYIGTPTRTASGTLHHASLPM